MKRKSLVLVALVASALLLIPIAVAQEQPYGNESNETGRENWTDNRTEVDLENTSHYIARVGTFVVGEDPTDPGVGPIFVGLLVGLMGLTVLGQSRAGLIASVTMGVVTVGALSAPQGAGFLPRWLYGTVVLLVALVAGIIYVRMMR
jgi:hypothetical protein